MTMRMDDEPEAPRGPNGMGAFAPVSSRVSFPKQEEETLAFWKERDIFKKSVQQREGAPPFVFFEGPPTANGSPGIHHVLARVFKDLFPRYKTMQGFQSQRKGGWDTHGLPVELEVEKSLNLKSKPDIEAYGIEAFNRKCRESVFRYVKDWERMTDRIAFWVDLEDAYVTYDNDYIESEWWIVKQLWDAGLVYEGRRVAPHCPRCGTTLSSHEVAQGYDENTPDPSVYVKFRVDLPGTQSAAMAGVEGHEALARSRLWQTLETLRNAGGPVHLLAWTTTPWTLPGNSGLSVSAKDDYALVRLEKSGELLVLAKARLAAALKEEHAVLAEFPGANLAGLRYFPLYNPWEHQVSVLRFRAAGSAELVEAEQPTAVNYPVITADFVSMEDGTGIVHTSPPFGADDYEVGIAKGLYFVQPVDLAGKFVGDYKWAGRFVKNADPMIMDDLQAQGLLFRRETIRHTYPFCWRCHTPLLYYAKSSWYLKTTAVKTRLLEANQEIQWTPEHIKDGRFGEWLAGNIDWAVSRERYWGTPWPVWKCHDCGAYEPIGSREELSKKPKLSGFKPDLDLHRPYIDAVTFACKSPALSGAEVCSGTMKRVPEVMDAWFDSGAMPFAQWHYPFEHKTEIEDGEWYPADFICEAIDQTRGWFYSLHAIGALLEQATEGAVRAPTYKSVICLGHILDAKGEKMSKSKGNVVNPWEVIDAHGVDAIRWYLYTATPPGNSRRFSAALVAEAVRGFLLTLWNTYSFFVTYANIDGWKHLPGASTAPKTELDRWILSKLHTLVGEVTEQLDEYDPQTAARKIEAFVDDLSNWYVRRSRRRFWKSENDGDKAAAYETLYECLTTLSKVLAPFTPYLAEALYQNLVCANDPEAPESVHLANYPVADATQIDETLTKGVDLVVHAVSLGRAARSKAKIRVRQPLGKLVVATRSPQERETLQRQAAQLREELNIKELAFVDAESELVEYRVKPNMAKLGPKFGPKANEVMRAVNQAEQTALATKVRAGGDVELGGVTLEPGDLEVAAVDKPGYAAASEGGLTVAVTTEITPELRMEGQARELVHAIQNLRKTAGFEIADRIVTYYEGDATLAHVFATHADYIKQETLSERLVPGKGPECAPNEKLKFEGTEVGLAVSRG